MAQSARLLIVDDEAALLRLMKVFLERMGYHVDTCDNIDDACAQLPKDTSVDAAIFDLSLLRGTGDIIDVARRCPALRILVCSGALFDVAALPDDIRARCAFLQKPFLPKMLVESVEELLARTPA